MPKTNKYAKKQPKKTKPKKPQPKPVSITTRKSYWATLTALTVVFASAYGYIINMPLESIVMMLATVLLLIGFACYIRFTPFTATANKRATFIFVGACVIGFSIWATMILILSTPMIRPPAASAIGNFFVTTSLIICLISGAFIGDLIGKHRESLNHFINNKLRK